MTQRNGLGQDGGRVLQVAADTSAGTRTYTGTQLRSLLGLKSDWFTPSAVETAPPVPASALARALYVDILGREGDAAGVNGWTAALAGGADVRAAAQGFAGSAERYNNLVTAAYQAALHRAPDPGGARGWLGMMVQGGTINDLNAALFSSEESLAVLGGGDTEVWVDGVYQALLGGGADTVERAYWTTVARQVGRYSVARDISTSGEARDRRLNGYYLGLLGRPMDQGGRATFSPYLAGRGDVDIVAVLASSAEYRIRAQARFP